MFVNMSCFYDFVLFSLYKESSYTTATSSFLLTTTGESEAFDILIY